MRRVSSERSGNWCRASLKEERTYTPLEGEWAQATRADAASYPAALPGSTRRRTAFPALLPLPLLALAIFYTGSRGPIVATLAVRAALLEGVRNPPGRGLGATTLAAHKYGSGGGSTEADRSDILVALGLIGGILYLMIVGAVLVTALQLWHRTRSPMSLGILLVCSGLWLNAGFYAANVLVWLCVGALDKLRMNRLP